MNPAGNNIIDLLLGNLIASPKTPLSTDSPTVAFGDLLATFLPVKGEEVALFAEEIETVSGKPGSVTLEPVIIGNDGQPQNLPIENINTSFTAQLSDLLPLDTNPKLVVDEIVGNESHQDSQSATMIPVPVVSDNNTASVVPAISDNNPAVVEPFMVVPKDAITIPQQPVIASETMISDLSGQSFKVLDWSLKGDVVHFDLVAADKPDTVIRVTIPVDQLKHGGQNTTQSLVANSAYDRQTLATTERILTEDLLTRLNVKELHFEVATKTVTPTGGSPVQAKVAIIAGISGQEIVIKSKINRSAIRVKQAERIDSTFLSSKVEAGRTIVDVTERNSGTNVGTAREAVSTAARPTDWFDKTFGDSFKSLGAPSMSNSATSSNAVPVSDYIQSGTEATVSREFGHSEPVTFRLPENIAGTLKPNGQSVTLRLEPEHLGSARLHLAIRGGRLRAVIIVDSLQAKLAVEGSIEHLEESLAKADIAVDKIDVNINQDQAEQQLFDRWASPQRSVKSAWKQNTEAFEAEHIDTISPLVPGATYVHASGVNILA